MYIYRVSMFVGVHFGGSTLPKNSIFGSVPGLFFLYTGDYARFRVLTPSFRVLPCIYMQNYCMFILHIYGKMALPRGWLASFSLYFGGFVVFWSEKREIKKHIPDYIV